VPLLYERRDRNGWIMVGRGAAEDIGSTADRHHFRLPAVGTGTSEYDELLVDLEVVTRPRVG
jgi:hypothetical protein